MRLDKFSDEQIKKMSLIELANNILADQKKEMNFIDLFQKAAEIKGLTDAEKDNLLARFYTDLNVDGRFTTLGSNVWGLKRWYPVDQTTEKSLAESRKRDMEEEEEFEDEEEFQDEEGFDELDDEESEASDKDESAYDDYDRIDYDE